MKMSLLTGDMSFSVCCWTASVPCCPCLGCLFAAPELRLRPRLRRPLPEEDFRSDDEGFDDADFVDDLGGLDLFFEAGRVRRRRRRDFFCSSLMTTSYSTTISSNPSSGLGNWGLSSSSVSVMMLPTTKFRYHLLSEGTINQGAYSVLHFCTASA